VSCDNLPILLLFQLIKSVSLSVLLSSRQGSSGTADRGLLVLQDIHHTPDFLFFQMVSMIS